MGKECLAKDSLGKDPDNWTSCCGGVKAGFAFVLIGIILHAVQIAAFALPLAGMNYLDFEVMGNKIVAIVASAVLFFFYMLGWTIPLGQCAGYVDELNKESYVDLAPGASIAMLIMTWIFMLILIALGYMVMQESSDEETGESPKTVELGVEGEEADQVPPPGAVYQKNGVWLDKDDNPVKSDPAAFPPVDATTKEAATNEAATNEAATTEATTNEAAEKDQTVDEVTVDDVIVDEDPAVVDTSTDTAEPATDSNVVNT